MTVATADVKGTAATSLTVVVVRTLDVGMAVVEGGTDVVNTVDDGADVDDGAP